MGFQVALKCGCLFACPKCNGCFDAPWSIFASVGNLAGVVFLKTGFQIVCETGVMGVFVGFAFEDVDVVE